jgi:hypothetical protein
LESKQKQFRFIPFNRYDTKASLLLEALAKLGALCEGWNLVITGTYFLLKKLLEKIFVRISQAYAGTADAEENLFPGLYP